MDLRAPARLSAALLLAVVAAGCHPPARPLRLGSVLNVAGTSGDAGSLVWVVPASEFRVCAPVAASLRDLQRGAAGAPPLTVVYVGPHPEWMTSYLRAQRLRANPVGLTEVEYLARFGAAPFHALYRVRGGRVAAVLSPDLGPGWEVRLRAFAAAPHSRPGREEPTRQGPHP
jgi:hypothetical protein